MVQPSLMRIRFGQLELDERRFLLKRGGVRLQIRPKVFDLLAHLIRNRERVVLRDELIMALWGTTAIGLGSLSGLVNELRQILGETGRGPSSIRTVHARGYQFVAKIETSAPDEPQPALGGSGAIRDDMPDRRIAKGLGPFGEAGGVIRASLSRVSSDGAQAVIVVGPAGSNRSNLLDRAGDELSRAGFEIHRVRVVTLRERHPNALVDQLLEALVGRYGLDAVRSAIGIRARELLERVGTAASVLSARPRDPLASRQYDEQIWRSASELLSELARRRPLAVVLDDRDWNATAATLALSRLLRPLGKAPVFLLFAAATAPQGRSAPVENADRNIEYVRLPPPHGDRLNQLLESRGLATLPAALAEALLAHVGDEAADLESIAGWLQAERIRAPLAGDEPVLSSTEPRMKRVEPDAISRRRRMGAA